MVKEKEAWIKKGIEHEYWDRLHGLSACCRDRINPDTDCGCFYCLKRFKGCDIKEWTDRGKTPICPHCAIDSVLPFDEEILNLMHAYWFEV